MAKDLSRLLKIGVSFVILFLVFSGTAFGAEKISDVYAPDRVLVKFKQAPDAAALKNFAAAHNLNFRNEIPRIAVYNFSISDKRGVAKVVEKLSSDPRVEFAEPDYLRFPAYTPNDPMFSSQWDMSLMGLPAYWDFITGNPYVVTAVIDTGIDLTHPDLTNRLWQNPGEIYGNGIDDEGNGYVDDIWGYDFAGDGVFPAPGAEDSVPNDDYVGHGTHVSGTIAAQQDNGIGISGEAPGTKLMAVRVLGGILGSGYSSDIAEGITYATDNGAKVLNMSLGGSSPSLTEYLALKHAWDNNVFIAAASGNEAGSGNPVGYPAAFVFTMSVGATDNLDNIASFSTHNVYVEISAPGVNILSTVPPGTYEGGWDGTSMACPHVAGLAALIYSTYSGVKNWQVRAMLQSSAIDRGTPGWDQYFGYGRASASRLIPIGPPSGDNLNILSPPNGGIFPSGSIMALLWNPVTGAASYRITATLPSSATVVINSNDPYYTHPPSSPAPSGTYNITVEALNGAGAPISSDTVSFVKQ